MIKDREFYVFFSTFTSLAISISLQWNQLTQSTTRQRNIQLRRNNYSSESI